MLIVGDGTLGINQLRYSQELEKELAKGKRLQEAHDEAVKRGTIKPKAESEEGAIKRAWARLKALFGGGETTRTKTIKSGLKTAGLTQKEIDRLQGKK